MRRRLSSKGVTLVELMVAVAIITIGILGFFGAFKFITVSLHVSRTRTLATNLGQEKIESLKNLSYYELLITTATSQDNNFSPAVVYDNSNYPPEQISIGGITFTRYTFVALAQIDSDVISTVTYTYPDTGMKQITTTTVWNDHGVWRKWVLNNLLENPNIAPLDASISGYVNTSAGSLAGAYVFLEQDPTQNQLAASNGSYSFRVYHGSYTVRASSAGYYDGVSSVIGATEGSNTQVSTITLTAIATGTIVGEAWISSSVVISQVCTSTVQADTTYNVGYVELYNPTTNTVTVYDGTNALIKLNFATPCSSLHTITCSDATYGIKMTYVNTTIPPYGYYLFANTTTFRINGTLITADAYYADDANTHCSVLGANPWVEWTPPTSRKIMGTGHAGSVWLTDSSNNIIDAVGWAHGVQLPAHYNGNYINYTSGWPSTGYGEQLVRISSPAANLSASDMNTYGHAYDSRDNSNDFFYPTPITASPPATLGIQFTPRTTANAPKAPIAGVPAVGSYVAASDPYSGITTAQASYISSGSLSLLHAPFTLPGVTTTSALASCGGNCWVVDVASGNYYAEYSTITIAQGLPTGVPNANSVPAWDYSNMYHIRMASTSTGGFVKGNITDIHGAAISGLSVVIGANNKTTGSNGNYFSPSSSGTVTVVANPNNTPPYGQVVAFVNVPTGQIATQDFIMGQAGALQGYMTAGTTPLPNYTVSATVGGSQVGSGASNASGVFTIRNLSTGTYVISPVIENGQDSNPNSITATVISTATVFIGTFTITGAMGTIAGTIQSNGVTTSAGYITSGALILASTSTISSTPPAIAASSSAAQAPMYAISSLADGTYSLSVRGGFSYYLSVYVPVFKADGTVQIDTQTFATPIAVTAGQTTTKAIVLP